MKEVKAAAAAAKGGGGARGARAAKGGRRAAKAQGSDEEVRGVVVVGSDYGLWLWCVWMVGRGGEVGVEGLFGANVAVRSASPPLPPPPPSPLPLSPSLPPPSRHNSHPHTHSLTPLSLHHSGRRLLPLRLPRPHCHPHHHYYPHHHPIQTPIHTLFPLLPTQDAARSLSDSSAPSSAPSGESDPEDENADAEGQFHDVRKRKFEERQEAQSRPARQAPIRKARDAGVPRPARDAFNRALLSLLQRVVSDPELSTPVPEYHESLVAGFLSEGLLKSIEDYQVSNCDCG